MRRDGASLFVTVHGRDALSLLDGAEFVFNNGYRERVRHPMDGINDGREETYELQISGAKVPPRWRFISPTNPATRSCAGWCCRKPPPGGWSARPAAAGAPALPRSIRGGSRDVNY